MTGQAPDIQLPWDLHYGEANSPWEVRQKVRLLAHDGVDLIKMLSTGAVLTHGSSPMAIEFTEEELQAGVDEASHFGCASPCMPTPRRNPKRDSRRRSFGGARRMLDDDLIAMAKQHETYLDMDIYDEECIQAGAATGQTPADFLQHDADLGRIQRENFGKAVRAGVKMAFGTDAGVCAYGTSGKQFAFMVKYGMTPMQAIQAATSNAADLLGHADRTGIDQARKVRRFGRGERRSLERHQRTRERRVCHERRQGLQVSWVGGLLAVVIDTTPTYRHLVTAVVNNGASGFAFEDANGVIRFVTLTGVIEGELVCE